MITRDQTFFNESNFQTTMAKKTILLTGASGFVGQHVLQSLLKDDLYHIYALHRSQPELEAARHGRLEEEEEPTDSEPVDGSMDQDPTSIDTDEPDEDPGDAPAEPDEDEPDGV